LNMFIEHRVRFSRSGQGQRSAVAGPERLSVRDGRRVAPRGRAEAAAHAPAGPDRVRQDDGRRRAGHAVRLRPAARAAPDAAAERGLRGRGVPRLRPGPATAVLADVRATVVPGAPGQPAGRRRLAADADIPVPRRRRRSRPADVHQDHRHGRLT